MSINVFQLHKPEATSFTEIQDRFKISKDCNVIALADGTTQGYKSEIWAQYLVDEFVRKPEFEADSFTEFIKQTSKKYNKECIKCFLRRGTRNLLFKRSK